MVTGVIISALVYAAAFLRTDVCWSFLFVCFIPLFKQTFRSPTTAFLQGMIWGALVYGLVGYAFFEIILTLGTAPSSYLCAIGLLFYCAIITGVWFTGTYLFAYCLRSWVIAWVVSTMLYFLFVHAAFFFPITYVWQGCGLFCPVVPLVSLPRCAALMSVVGWQVVCFFLIALQAVLVYLNVRIFTLIAFMGMVYGCFYEPSSYRHHERSVAISIPSKNPFKTICAVSINPCMQSPYERAQEVCHALLQAEQLYPEARVLVLPESAFPFPLNEHGYAIQMWQNNGRLDEKYVIVGAHYQDNKKLYNSAYVLHRRRIIHRYDKKALMPFFEAPVTTPLLAQLSKKLFLSGKKQFHPGSRPLTSEPFEIPGVGPISLCICSELLWNYPSSGTVIALVNNSYFQKQYMKDLFKLFAQLQACCNGTSLFYVGFE